MSDLPATLPDCPNGALVALGEHTLLLAPARCKRWRCPDCGWRKARDLARRIMLAQPTRFVTLTVRPSPALTAKEELDRMNKAWRNVWKRIKRLYGDRAYGYVRIVELHKSGVPHLHIAMRCPYLPQSTLSRWWHNETSSPIVDIRAIRTERGLSRYLAKYLTKSYDQIPGSRKWSQTRDFLPSLQKQPREPEEIRPTWQWTPAKLETLQTAMRATGWHEYEGLWVEPGWAQPPEAPS